MKGEWRRRRETSLCWWGNKDVLSCSQPQPVRACIISSLQALTDNDEKKEGVGVTVVGQTG